MGKFVYISMGLSEDTPKLWLYSHSNHFFLMWMSQGDDGMQRNDLTWEEWCFFVSLELSQNDRNF